MWAGLPQHNRARREGEVQGKGQAAGGWQPWSGMSCLAIVGSIRGHEGRAALAGVGAGGMGKELWVQVGVVGVGTGCRLGL